MYFGESPWRFRRGLGVPPKQIDTVIGVVKAKTGPVSTGLDGFDSP